jgi:branched-chain amino acid transport system ATP-binding protein
VTLLTVTGLAKSYAGVQAVRDLSYEVPDGSISGLIGPNGSGKSTSIIDCISGFLRPDEGRWSLAGRDLNGMPAHAMALAGLTRTFQTVRAYGELSLLENLCERRRNMTASAGGSRSAAVLCVATPMPPRVPARKSCWGRLV